MNPCLSDFTRAKTNLASPLMKGILISLAYNSNHRDIREATFKVRPRFVEEMQNRMYQKEALKKSLAI